MRARGRGVADPLAREPGARTMASTSELILQDAGLDALASQTSSPVATSPAAQSPAVSPRDQLAHHHNRDEHHQQHHHQQHGKSDPSWVWSCLFSKDLSKKANPCFVPIADVIIFEEASDHDLHDVSNGAGKRKAKKKRNQSRKSLRLPTRWVYTNDKGKLSYRTGKAISWNRIRDAFLALNEDENSICRVTMVNGSSHTLDRATFQALLAGAKRDGGLSAVRTMQACVSLSKGREQLCCRASYSRQHGCRAKVLGGVPENTLDFETALAGMCSEFVAALEVSASTPIEALSLDFAADRDGVLRVVQVSEVIRVLDKRDDPREEDTHRPNKRALTKPARRRGPSGRSDTAKLHTSSSPSLPSLSCRRDARSSSSSNAKSASGPTTSSLALRCSGDFCGLRVNQSNGLDVIEIDTWKSKEKVPHNASLWSAELDRVRAASASRKHRRPEDSRMPSSSSMHKVGQRDILLARHAMHFITGAVRITDAALRDEEEFGRAWRQLDEKLQYDLGVKHPDQFYQDAQVCESCEQVYKRLETIRARNYNRAPVQRPQSEREGAVRSDSTVKASSSPSLSSSSKRHEVTSAPGRSESVSERSTRKEKGLKQKSSALSRRSRKEDGSVADQSSHGSKALTVPKKAKSEQHADGTESQSKHSKPSLAETAFLMRHADQLRSEQQAKVLQQERQESIQEIERLRRDQQSNVAQIKALREALTKASHEAASQTAVAEELGDSLRATQETLNTSQRGFTRVMQEKDEEIKRLALEMERVRHAALAAQSQGETSESLSAQLLDAAQAEHRLSQKVGELSQQVKDLEAENEALTTASAKTKKEILREVQGRTQDEVAKLTAEVERLSTANDEQTAESSELRHLLETQREKEAELRRQVNQLGGEKQRLQGHLDKAKQSLKSITSLGNSEDAAMAAVRATAEAKVQQVKNELDFVRKQAETESGFAEELRGQLTELKRQQAEVVSKLKQESSELATRLKAELAERENQFARELQIPRSQISLLEDKVSTLQTSLQKMGNEMAATNRKLQVSEMDLRRARDEALRSEEQKLALERNLAELQATLATQSAHQDDKTYEDGSGGDIDSGSGFNADSEEGGTHTATSDQSAQLVRVQNEVEYLRKQVGVEECAKRELSKAVETTRAQLRKTIEDWKADVAAIQAQHRHILEQAESEAVALREAKLDATSEIKRLQSQLLEAREGFSRAKEQLQTDQRALEASASAVSQLKEDLDEAQSRLAAAQERAERAESQHKEEVHNLREELEAVREKRQEVVADLKSKLTNAHRQVSASHAAMLELRESSTQEMEVLSRQGAIRLIVAAFQGRARLQACSAFYRMRTATVAASERQAAAEFANSLRKQHEETLRAELASLRSQMTRDAQKELRRELEKSQREHESAVRAIEKSCDEKRQRELDEARTFHHEALAVQLAEQQAIREAEEKRQREEARRAVATLEATHKAAFQSMVTRAAQERDEEVRTAREALQKQLRESLEEARKQHNAQLAEATERHDQALAAMREKLTRDKDQAVASMMNSAETDCKCALEALECEMQSRIDAIRQELEDGHAAALKNSQEESAREADAKLAFALQERAEKAAQDLAELRKELESVAHEEHARLSRKHEDRVEQLTAEHRAHIRTLKEKHEADLAAQLDASMSKLEEAVRRTREEERAERTQALTQSTEKWQRIVQECTEDGLREQERLVAEAAKAKAAAVEKVKLEARADIAARDTASTKSRAAFEEKLLQKSQAQLDELRDKLMAEHAKQLQAATEAAGKREEAALLRAQAEKERALRVQRNKATEQLERVKQEAETAKESALATCAREAASQMASALNREREQASEKLKSLRESMERERKESEAAILEECDRVTDRKLEEAQLQLQEAVLKCRKQCEDQFGKELEQMRRERTQLMDDADHGMQAAHAERDRLRASLEKANAALEEAEDLAFDLQGRVERLEQAGRFFALKQKLEHGRTVAGFCRLKQRLEASTAEHIAEAEKRVNNQVERHEAQTQRAEEATRTLEKSRRRMHDILVNHKREDLLQHKVETGVIQDDLKKLRHSQEALEKQREQLQRDVGYLEGQIRGVEQQLEQLSKVSAVQDGQINVTHAKRKRRLDQEFEHLLDRVAHQRKQIDAVNERIAAVQEDAELKEEDLREMEARLVAILVEQQKLLLAELASVEKRSNQQTIDRQRQLARVK